MQQTVETVSKSSVVSPTACGRFGTGWMERGSTSMLQPNEDRAAAGIAKPLSGEKSTKAEKLI